MTRLTKPDHGGDPAAAENHFGQPAFPWLDLSTGINPLPIPLAPLPGAVAARLPDSRDLADTLKEARSYYGAPKHGAIVASPGTQAAMQWLPRLRPVSRVVVWGPTYAEHAHVWRLAGHQVSVFRHDDSGLDDADVVVVVNPNNPDGRRISSSDLLTRKQALANRGGWLVVDEAFCDVTPEISLAGHVGDAGLIILRSFGKFFGLAGYRLGFVLGWPELTHALADALGPWAVSGPALWAGAEAFRDRAWIDETRRRLYGDAARLDCLLAARGFDVIGGTDLFRLVRYPGAVECHEALARRGILVRRFTDHRDWLRFGLPGTLESWGRLEAALAEIQKG